MTKALVLFSGGLDSTLAARLLQDQPGLSVVGVHFTSLFTANHPAESDALPARRTARELGLPLRVEENGCALLALVKRPRFGLGRNMNPCIDCRIRNVRRALEVMREVGADFIATGEVVGERPMSQNRQALRLVEKESGADGLLLRPLSALLLDPTLPEQRGWVERERMLDISGRSRRRQMELARRYGIPRYPSPAGGCLLTDPGFGARMRDLLEHDPGCDLNDCALLKVGRHFRLGAGVKIIVGRDERENGTIESLARADDLLMEAVRLPGPTTLVRGRADDSALAVAAAVTARYGKGARRPSVAIRVRRPGEAGALRELETVPATDDAIRPLRIASPETGGKRRGSE